MTLKKNTVKQLMLFSVKSYYEAMLVAMVCHWDKVRHAEQCIRIQNPEIEVVWSSDISQGTKSTQ
jgi:hypothetical protein